MALWPAWQVVLGVLSPALRSCLGASGLCWETEFPISRHLSTCCVLGSGGCDRTPVPAPRGGDIQTEEAT